MPPSAPAAVLALRRIQHGSLKLDLGILAGVTRAVMIEAAPAAGYEVAEGAYPLADVLGSEEVFTTSSVREVMPVVQLDGEQIERGPAADALQQALRKEAER